MFNSIIVSQTMSYIHLNLINTLLIWLATVLIILCQPVAKMCIFTMLSILTTWSQSPGISTWKFRLDYFHLHSHCWPHLVAYQASFTNSGKWLSYQSPVQVYFSFTPMVRLNGFIPPLLLTISQTSNRISNIGNAQLQLQNQNSFSAKLLYWPEMVISLFGVKNLNLGLYSWVILT